MPLDLPPDLQDEDFLRWVAENATPEERAKYGLLLKEMAEQERNRWTRWARPEQLAPPGEWVLWLLITGRRWGKTRSAAEWLRERALAEKGTYAICAPTYGDVRDVCVEGGMREPVNRRSGLISVCNDGEVENYNRSIGEIKMANGSKIKMLSADEPDRARGWGFNAAWCDEVSSWRRPQTWYETLLPAVTLSDTHRFVVTTTPKPNKLTTALIKRAQGDSDVVLTRGFTKDNENNLGRGAFAELRSQMTERQARQELDGELLTDVPGARWTWDLIDSTRVDKAPDMTRVTLNVDPSGSSGPDNDEQGITVTGLGVDQHGYLLDDRSCTLSPNGWGRRTVQAYLDWKADLIVVERNYGGDMAEATIKTAAKDMGIRVNVKMIVSSRGKVLRAEPVAALYEQGRFHHVGAFPQLEEQMTSWTPESGQSPDRLDSACFGASELMLQETAHWSDAFLGVD